MCKQRYQGILFVFCIYLGIRFWIHESCDASQSFRMDEQLRSAFMPVEALSDSEIVHRSGFSIFDDDTSFIDECRLRYESFHIRFYFTLDQLSANVRPLIRVLKALDTLPMLDYIIFIFGGQWTTELRASEAIQLLFSKIPNRIRVELYMNVHGVVTQEECARLVQTCKSVSLQSIILIGTYNLTSAQWLSLCSYMQTRPVWKRVCIAYSMQTEVDTLAFIQLLRQTSVYACACNIPITHAKDLGQAIQYQIKYKSTFHRFYLRVSFIGADPALELDGLDEKQKKSPAHIYRHILDHVRYMYIPFFLLVSSATVYDCMVKGARVGTCTRTKQLLVLCSLSYVPRLGKRSPMRDVPLDLIRRLFLYLPLGL